MNKETRKPDHEFRLGRIVGAVWFNKDEQGGGWSSVQVSRLYKEGETWKRSSSFSRDDLPLVAKVADSLHTWIHQHANGKDNAIVNDADSEQASVAA